MNAPALRRAAIWLKAAMVVAAYLLLIWLVHRLVFTRYIDHVPLSVAVAVTAAQFVVAAVMVSFLLITRRLTEIRTRRSARVTPGIREELATYATGQGQRWRLTNSFQRFPDEFEACLTSFLCLITGREHQQLCEFIVESSLVAQWEKRYHAGSTVKRRGAVESLARMRHPVVLKTLTLALSDQDESIQIRAASALVRFGSIAEVEKVFAFAMTQPLHVRALLAEELRLHLPLLCERVIPETLGSGRGDEILRTLDLLQAWRRSLKLPVLSALLRSPDPEIRAKAWQVRPFVAETLGLGENISIAILDGTQSVSAAAATAAGSMKLASAVPALKRQLRGGNETVMLAAARALSLIGRDGLSVLETEVVAGTRVSAAAALEALEKSLVGRQEW